MYIFFLFLSDSRRFNSICANPFVSIQLGAGGRPLDWINKLGGDTCNAAQRATRAALERDEPTPRLEPKLCSAELDKRIKLS